MINKKDGNDIMKKKLLIILALPAIVWENEKYARLSS